MANAWIKLVKSKLDQLKKQGFKGKIMIEAIKLAKKDWVKIKK